MLLGFIRISFLTLPIVFVKMGQRWMKSVSGSSGELEGAELRWGAFRLSRKMRRDMHERRY
jgi:hypothetical protein